MKRLIPFVALLFVTACGGDNGPTALPPTTSAPYSQTELVVGTGTLAQPGNQVTVAYTGWLHDSSRPEAKGTQFEQYVRGVAVQQITEDQKAPRLEYDPGHPHANPEGYVAYPNINPVEEMVDMITASRAYEAGITTMSTAVNMAERALGIGR